MIAQFARRSRENVPVVVELEDVPRAADLIARGMAEPHPRGILILPAGHALLGEIQARNAAKVRAALEQRPPIVEAPPMSAAQQAHLWAQQAFTD